MVPLVVSVCPQQHCAEVGPHTDAASDTSNGNRVYLPKWMYLFVTLLPTLTYSLIFSLLWF